MSLVDKPPSYCKSAQYKKQAKILDNHRDHKRGLTIAVRLCYFPSLLDGGCCFRYMGERATKESREGSEKSYIQEKRRDGIIEQLMF